MTGDGWWWWRALVVAALSQFPVAQWQRWPVVADDVCVLGIAVGLVRRNSLDAPEHRQLREHNFVKYLYTTDLCQDKS
jgi:hypothetical protein